MGKIANAIQKIVNIKLGYIWQNSKVTVEKGGVFKKGKNVKIKNSKIYVKQGDTLILGDNTTIKDSNIYLIVGEKNHLEIGENCKILNYNFALSGAHVNIGDYNVFEKNQETIIPSFQINGELIIGHYNRLRCSIWSRFNAKVKIGDRNAINERTEIRSDEAITIGSYNQISYDCVFWDTNTHNLYKAEKRRQITDEQYPDFGLEFEKPKTAPITIGDDCWIGRGVSVLKGTSIANKCVVAYGTLLSNIALEENKTVFNQTNLKVIDNQI